MYNIWIKVFFKYWFVLNLYLPIFVISNAWNLQLKHISVKIIYDSEPYMHT